MIDYYDALNQFAVILKNKCKSKWLEECVVIAVVSICADFEVYLKQNANPHIKCTHSLLFWVEYLRRGSNIEDYYHLYKSVGFEEGDSSDIKRVHRELWGNIWPVFGKKTLEEIKAIVRKRLEGNQLDKSFFKDKAVIDLGCGGGRFSFVAHDLGAKKVLGIDFNEKNIKSAKQWVSEYGLSNIDFKVGSVYETGEPNASYDVAISNGVFHHLENPQAAYNESVRVLRDGGKMFLYVEAKGGIINELQEVIVNNIGHIPQANVFEILTRLGFSDHSRIYLMDYFFAHYEYVSTEEIHKRLRLAGYTHIEELKGEGMDYDHGYAQRMRDPWNKGKYGEGQLRLIVSK